MKIASLSFVLGYQKNPEKQEKTWWRHPSGGAHGL
jgi:hypothetical protein